MLLLQLQGKDEEILKYSEELVKLKAKVRDYEYSVPGLTSDKSRIEQELDETRQQLINAQRSLRELEPELERIRPEYMELRSERGMWQLERSQLKQEINRLQPLQQLLDDLHSGIMGLNHMDAGAGGGFKSSHGSAGVGESKIGSLEDLAMRSPRAYPGTPGGLSEASTPPAPPPPLTAVSPSNTPELSQRHSMWVALPQLRNLSAPLYEKIRSLAHDLHIKEMQCLEMQRNLVRLRSEANVGRRESEARAKQLQIVHDGTNHTIAALQERVAASEAEADHNRGAKALLEQIKVVMASYPVSWEALEYGHHAKNMDQSFSSECTSSNAIFLLEKVNIQ